ncbi:class II fructose-bisphosphate aldolase family protein [Actinomadura nitritigenes]|uniref:Class II fructose-bisphosphate aldolase n=1 Tax=Actinomadura nitritigenes TaxID=134602 RepID=A0ABS3QU81_9ACTN|nr:class II fructose-bisphosphate aldolase [Actinomadura nitritigenes]MBO2437530.1 class II fructose-bisphosphate aldolase [Actinomadura nitritigenes]
MPLVNTAELVRPGEGVAAFNVITLEHAEAIVAAAEETGRPVICQISQNAVRFHGGRLGPIAAGTRAVAEGSAARVALHLDHVTDEDLMHQAADHGFGSVMYDGSEHDYDENVARTAAAAAWAHERGLWLEAELGEVGGKDGAHAPGVRTDPGEAAAFVAATGVDALAVAVGSSHAMTERTAVLDHALIARLRDAVPVPLVLHGSSGVADDELRRAVGQGMTKINIGTALNIAFTGAVRANLDRGVDPRRYLAPARDAMREQVAHLLEVIAPRSAESIGSRAC